jgi:hypothetical protein
LKRLKVRIQRLQALIGLAEEPVGVSVCTRRRRLGLHDPGGSHEAGDLIPVAQRADPDRGDIGGAETRRPPGTG